MVRLAVFAIAALLVLVPVQSRAAESVVADLTIHDVAVKVDFAGANVLLFGSVLATGQGVTAGPPDVVIAVRGPDRPLKVRRKERTAGIWINRGSMVLRRVPGYYALVTTRDPAKITDAETLARLKIGFAVLKADMLANAVADTGLSEAEVQPYVEAALRLLKKQSLHQIHNGGVSFTGRHLFRAEFSLPANVPLGSYLADVYVIRDGRPAGHYASPLRIEKRGFERLVYSLAHDRPFVYGLVSVVAAALAGLGAAAAFRKA